MNDQLFHGYNCFATAVGQHLINIKKYKAMETVVLRWTFDCNKCWISENVWSVGTCVEAADYLLQYDLEKLEGIKISESKEESFQKSLEIAQKRISEFGSHVVLVDFYYLKSIDWKRMERFGYFPKHLPHFICITQVNDSEATYQDPMYKFCGKISISELEFAQKLNVCGVEHVGTYYDFDFKNYQNKYTFENKIEYQLKRYLKNQQFKAIAKFAIALSDNLDTFFNKSNMEWAFNFYLALESVPLQRQNFMLAIREQYPECSKMIMKLIMDWIKIRKKFHQLYNQKDINVLRDIIDSLNEISIQEEIVPEKLLERLQNDKK